MPGEDSGLTVGLKPGVRTRGAGHWLFVNCCWKSGAGARRLQELAVELACPQAGWLPGDVEASYFHHLVPGRDTPVRHRSRHDRRAGQALPLERMANSDKSPATAGRLSRRRNAEFSLELWFASR